MSSRPMPFRSGDDDARAAVAPMLDELRGDLLVLPSEDVVEKHLDMMAFERRVLATPRVERPARRVPNRPRRTAFVLGCVAATIASCGLSAAGALPEPLQKITNSIAHTLGVPQSHDDGTSTGTAPITGHEPAVPAEQPRTDTPSSNPGTKSGPTKPAGQKPRATTHEPTKETPPSSTPTTEPVDPPAFPARPTEPPGRVTPKPPTEPPSNNSQNTPPGYPTDWREQAIDAAAAPFELCAVSDSLAPAGCPQSVVAPGAENVTWQLLGDPTDAAAAVATTTKDAAGEPSTLVTVYERFRMVATYTLPTTGAKEYYAYSSGIAQVTMTWSGSQFENLTMTTGSVAGHVMPGVTVPDFAKPDTWDYVVALKVQRAFERCTAGGTPDSTCPAGGLLDAPSTNQSTLNGNVLSASEVGFNGDTGLYRVRGQYSLTSPSGAPVTGTFTATLFSDGAELTVLSVTAG